MQPSKRNSTYQFQSLFKIVYKKLYQGFQAYKESRQKNVALADAPTGAQHDTHLKNKTRKKRIRGSPTKK